MSVSRSNRDKKTLSCLKKKVGFRLIKTKTIKEWLGSRKLDFNPRLSNLSDHSKIKDRDVAVERIAKAILAKQRITLLSDYDSDGMTSCTILTEAIRHLGGNAIPLVSSRFDGGYGFSERMLERANEHRPDLVITLDCGSSDHDRLAKLKCDAIVIDHHLVPEKPLPALAFLNPHRLDCPSTYKYMASCGLAWSVVCGLRRTLDNNLDVKQWLDLVAIGTVADVMPLDGDNRILVYHGFQVLNERKRSALLDVAKICDPITGRDISFRIAPLLNAPARLGPPDIAIEMLMNPTSVPLAEKVKELADQRREQCNVILEEALQDVRHDFPTIVVGRPTWNHGVVGIVAARLCDQFKKPCIVIGHGGTGSVRGPAGSRLYDGLKNVAHLLKGFGGHQAAAGLSIDFENLDKLQRHFVVEFDPPTNNKTMQVLLDDEPWDVLADLALLEPCGQGNPKPAISITGPVVSHRSFRGGHNKLVIKTPCGEELSCFCPVSVHLSATEGVMTLTGDLKYSHYCGTELLVNSTASSV